MKILIFEGIATSGKTTVINRLIKTLPRDLKTGVYTEEFTHIPIINKTNDLCNDFFAQLITEAMANNYELAIFDRLYLTQAYRTKASLDKYLDIETLLFVNQVETIFLEVNEEEIAERITQSVKHRDPDWGTYVGTKGETAEEQAAYYIKQQRGLSALLGTSILPHETYEATGQDYEWIISELKEKILRV